MLGCSYVQRESARARERGREQEKEKEEEKYKGRQRQRDSLSLSFFIFLFLFLFFPLSSPSLPVCLFQGKRQAGREGEDRESARALIVHDDRVKYRCFCGAQIASCRETPRYRASGLQGSRGTEILLAWTTGTLRIRQTCQVALHD